ncbi:MAG: phage holin family protein [Acetobacteraceae bacterium]|nr:phage holin family protein [Acetobacteraceae bacterium]
MNQPDRSIPDLLGDLVGQTSTLVRQEVQLAKAELAEKAAGVGAAGASLGIGGALLLGALFILLQAFVVLLAEVFDLSPTLSAFIVALAAGLVGFLILRGGLAKLSPSNLTPDRTANQLSRDAEVVREQLR